MLCGDYNKARIRDTIYSSCCSDCGHVTTTCRKLPPTNTHNTLSNEWRHVSNEIWRHRDLKLVASVILSLTWFHSMRTQRSHNSTLMFTFIAFIACSDGGQKLMVSVEAINTILITIRQLYASERAPNGLLSTFTDAMRRLRNRFVRTTPNDHTTQSTHSKNWIVLHYTAYQYSLTDIMQFIK